MYGGQAGRALSANQNVIAKLHIMEALKALSVHAMHRCCQDREKASDNEMFDTTRMLLL